MPKSPGSALKAPFAPDAAAAAAAAAAVPPRHDGTPTGVGSLLNFRKSAAAADSFDARRGWGGSESNAAGNADVGGKRAGGRGETGASHVESSLQREFEELRGEYSALLERASRGKHMPDDLSLIHI